MRIPLMYRRLAAVALAGALALVACGDDGGSDGSGEARDGGREPDATEAGAATPAPEVVELGTYAVGMIEETFVDTSRPTKPNNTFPGSDERTFLTTIYYPAAGEPADEPVPDAEPLVDNGPYPLMLFSHGAGARGVFYQAVISKWVSAGYVVAAPDFPLSNTNAPGGVTLGSAVGDVGNQPADATFVIDQVLAQEDALLDGIVDPERIGAAGHSNGGITTFGLVYSQCCADDRIDAAIPMSGIAGIVDDGANYFIDVDTPLLIFHGDSDPLVPYQSGVDAYEAANAPKFLVTFIGAGHVNPFVDGQGPPGAVMNNAAVAFLDLYLKDDTAALDDLRDAVSPTPVATLQEDVGE